MDSEKLLRVNDVASYLSISRAKAYQLLERGEIATIRIGRSVRVTRADLDEFVAKSRRAA